MDLPRRSLIGIGIGTLVTGCASGKDAVSSPSAGPAPTPSPSQSVTRRPTALPVVRRWEVSPNDRVPACKEAAVRRIERDGTHHDHVHTRFNV